MLSEIQMYVMMVTFKNSTNYLIGRDRDMFVLLATCDNLFVDIGAMSLRFLGIRKFLGIMEVLDLSG